MLTPKVKKENHHGNPKFICFENYTSGGDSAIRFRSDVVSSYQAIKDVNDKSEYILIIKFSDKSKDLRLRMKSIEKAQEALDILDKIFDNKMIKL